MTTQVTRKVEVTQEDIRAGIIGDCRNCPVQRAMIRTFPEVDTLKVFGKEVDVCYNHWWRSTVLPLQVQAFIEAFDDKKPVEPFSFDMELSI